MGGGGGGGGGHSIDIKRGRGCYQEPGIPTTFQTCQTCFKPLSRLNLDKNILHYYREKKKKKKKKKKEKELHDHLYLIRIYLCVMNI